MTERKIRIRAEKPPEGIVGRCPCAQFKNIQVQRFVDAREYLKTNPNAIPMDTNIEAITCEPASSYGNDGKEMRDAWTNHLGGVSVTGSFRCYLLK